MDWFAAPFRDRATRVTHVILSARPRPSRGGFFLCGTPVGDAQRLATTNRAVPTTCDGCTRSLTGFADLQGD